MSSLLPSSLPTLEEIENLQLNDHLTTAKQYCEILLTEGDLSAIQQAEAHNMMGRILIDLHQWQQALDHLNIVYIDLANNDLGNELLAKLHQNMAYCYHNLLTWEAAIEHYQKAIHYLTRLQSILSLASTYINLGHVYYQLEQFELALQNYQIAMETNAFAEKPQDAAAIYNNIGQVYNKTGDSDKELYYYQKAESLLSPNNYPPLLATIYNNIGLTYTHQNKYALALEYLQKSLQIRRNQYGEQHALVANLHNNIGHCYLKQQKDNIANQYFQKTIAIRQTLNEQNHPFYANALHNLGIISMRQQQFQTALHYFEQSCQIRSAIFPPHHPEIAGSHLQMAECFFHEQNYNQAHQLADHAFTIFSGSSNTNLQSISVLNSPEPARLLQTLLLKSNIFLAQYAEQQQLDNLNAAYDYAQTAVLLTDELRKGYRSDGSKLVLASNGMTALEKSLQISLLQYNISQNVDCLEQAFTYSEKSKAVLLLGAIKDAEAKLLSAVDPELLAKESQIQRNLSRLDEKILKERSKTTPDTQKIHQYQAQHFDLYTEYESLLSHIEVSHPDYHYLKYNINTIGIVQVQHCLQQHQTNIALVSYMLTEHCLYAFVITSQLYEVLTIPVANNLKNTIEEFIEAINFLNQEDFILYGHQLYQILLEKPLQKISEHYPNLQQLIIIPDAELNYLPFEALLTKPANWDTPYHELPYLLHQCHVSYHYSVSLLYETMMRQRTILPDSFCGFAPVYAPNQTLPNNNTTQTLRKATVDGKSYNELLYSIVELQNIAVLFEDQQAPVQLCLYQDATEDNFKHYSQQYKYLHIAAHGILNKQHPELSGILLSGHQTDAEHDILYISETYHLKLHADLVVLSCCESGIGKMVRGEGMMAINRGFLYAGAKNIIYTLFKVYDQESAQLTEELFKAILTQRQPYHRALSIAKKHLIAQQGTTPKAWAGFVLLGN